MSRIWRLPWLAVLVLHGAGGLAWLATMPGGFPWLHPRTWANRFAPALAFGLVVLALASLRSGCWARAWLSLLAFPAAWAGAAVAARLAFPISAWPYWLAPMAAAGLMGGTLPLALRGRPAPRRAATLAVAALAGLAGAGTVVAQRGPDPDTRPLNPTASPRPGSPPGPERAVRLGPELMVHAGDGECLVRSGGLALVVQPMLRFLSRSPDRCWTILAPPAAREGPPLSLTALDADPDAGRVEAAYRGDGPATLAVAREPGAVAVEATATLPAPVYSHLNAFCDLEVRGHRRLALEFSPCPGARVEVRPVDYPSGRPARAACLDADGTFRVVEARSGEKGPFRELARGRLARGEPLAITLVDDGRPACRVVLEDWSAQAGTALSPTAGWGLPVNAIEFSLAGDATGSPANVFITLAGTSVGRGWDSVGHAAGTYRNRLRIEALPPPD